MPWLVPRHGSRAALFSAYVLAPESSVIEQGVDVEVLLRPLDKTYWEHLNVGDEVFLMFGPDRIVGSGIVTAIPDHVQLAAAAHAP